MKPILLLILLSLLLPTSCVGQDITPEYEYTESEYSISEADRETIARLLFLEGNTQSFECQCHIVSVIMNRYSSGLWGDTIDDVVYAENQFEPACSIPNAAPTETNYKAVDYVLSNGPTLPEYVLFFRADYHFSWDGYIPYTAIDETYFGYSTYHKALIETQKASTP